MIKKQQFTFGWSLLSGPSNREMLKSTRDLLNVCDSKNSKFLSRVSEASFC